jgi:hypothetical protein
VIFGDQVCTMHQTYKLHSYLNILAENSCWKIVKHLRELKDDVKHQREAEDDVQTARGGWRCDLRADECHAFVSVCILLPWFPSMHVTAG